MKKLESTILNMVLVLTLVSAVAAALLGTMYEVTKEPIAAIEKQTLADGIKKVLLEESLTFDNLKIDTITKNDVPFVIYTANVDGKEIGKAVKVSVQGFSPDLTVLTGFNAQGDILGYEVLKHAETPGLGAYVGTWFQKDGKSSVIGMNPSKDNLTVKKDGGAVDAITASTITSRAFLKAINMEYEAIYGDKPNGTTGATNTHTAPADSTVTTTDSTAVADTASVEAKQTKTE
jgi:electron transport complex protein RnfG